MTRLVIDTSGAPIVVALVGSDLQLIDGVVSSERAQNILPIISKMLVENQLKRADIQEIFCGVGPGGFTGLRVGIATARGLAIELGIPLFGVFSLAFHAAQYALDNPDFTGRLACLIDAKRGEYYQQDWLVGDGVSPDSALQTIPHTEADLLEGVIARGLTLSPKALAGAIKKVEALDSAAGDPYSVSPLYVRAPDADPPRLNVKIEPFRGSDIDEVVALEARCYRDPWNRAQYEAEAERADDISVRYVLRDVTGGARIIGGVFGAWMSDCWHLFNILVDPPMQGRGLGSKLLELFINECKNSAHGIGVGITLEVRVSNEVATAMYREHGFESVGIRPSYYPDGEDARIMWLT